MPHPSPDPSYLSWGAQSWSSLLCLRKQPPVRPCLELTPRPRSCLLGLCGSTSSLQRGIRGGLSIPTSPLAQQSRQSPSLPHKATRRNWLLGLGSNFCQPSRSLQILLEAHADPPCLPLAAGTSRTSLLALRLIINPPQGTTCLGGRERGPRSPSPGCQEDDKQNRHTLLRQPAPQAPCMARLACGPQRAC